MSKCEARLPSTTLPEELFLCTLGDESPSSIYVTTDQDRNVRIKALGGQQRPESIDAITFSQALALAKQNIPMVCIVKKNGIHQKALFACPVRDSKKSNKIVGVLIGVDMPSEDEKTVGELITPPTPDDVDTPSLERSIMSKMISPV